MTRKIIFALSIMFFLSVFTCYADGTNIFPAGIANSNYIDSNLNMNGHKILNALDVQTTGGPLTANSLVSQSYTTNKINDFASAADTYIDMTMTAEKQGIAKSDVRWLAAAEKYADDNDNAHKDNTYDTYKSTKPTSPPPPPPSVTVTYSDDLKGFEIGGNVNQDNANGRYGATSWIATPTWVASAGKWEYYVADLNVYATNLNVYVTAGLNF